MLRKLDEQFEEDTLARIATLLDRIKKLNYPSGVARYYGIELTTCLEAGALLGGLIVGSSLLELYIRGCLVRLSISSTQGALRHRKQAIFEKALEENRKASYYDFVDALVSLGIINEDDGSFAKRLYQTLRNPILHGLPRRFVTSHQDDFTAMLRDIMPVSAVDFGDIIEDLAIDYLEQIVSLFERILPLPT